MTKTSVGSELVVNTGMLRPKYSVCHWEDTR